MTYCQSVHYGCKVFAKVLWQSFLKSSAGIFGAATKKQEKMWCIQAFLSSITHSFSHHDYKCKLPSHDTHKFKVINWQNNSATTTINSPFICLIDQIADFHKQSPVLCGLRPISGTLWKAKQTKLSHQIKYNHYKGPLTRTKPSYHSALPRGGQMASQLARDTDILSEKISWGSKHLEVSAQQVGKKIVLDKSEDTFVLGGSVMSEGFTPMDEELMVLSLIQVCLPVAYNIYSPRCIYYLR